MNQTPGVTVVVPHYGDPVHATALVEALLADPPGAPLQVVVVDDASPQAFPERADLGIEVVRRATNGGFGAAVNAGAARARHDVLLVLNSDLELPAGFLEEVLTAARPHLPAVVAPSVVTVAGRRSGGHRFPSAHAQAVEWVSVLGRWQGRPWFDRAVGLTAPPASGRSRSTGWASGEALLLDLASFRAAGGFDESYYMYAEEVDLQRRLRDRGVPTVQVATTPVVHLRGGSSDPARVRAWLVSARFHYARRWGGERRLRAALTAATGLNLAVNLVRRATGRDVAPVAVAREELRLVWRVGRSDPQRRAT